MYDIELFSKIFAEGEILCMDDEFIESMKRLLDDKMSVRLKQFFERFEASGIRQDTDNPIGVRLTERVDKMHEILDTTIRTNTFHLDVINSKVVDLTSQLYVDTALVVIQDKKRAIEELTWLLENRRYWISEIQVRQKADYDDFFKRCETLAFATQSLDYSLRQEGLVYDLRYYEDLPRRVKANKEFFYSQKEKKRSTRMGSIMNSVNSIEIILHGLKYQEKCNELEIPRLARRSFKA